MYRVTFPGHKGIELETSNNKMSGGKTSNLDLNNMLLYNL